MADNSQSDMLTMQRMNARSMAINTASQRNPGGSVKELLADAQAIVDFIEASPQDKPSEEPAKG